MGPDSTDARGAAISRLKAKQGFRANVVVYLVINAFLVGIWAVSGGGYFWPVFVILGWGIGIVTHGWAVYGRRGISEDDIAREMDRGDGTVA